MKKSLSMMALAILSVVGFGQSRPVSGVDGVATDEINDGLSRNPNCPNTCIAGVRG